MNLLVAMLVQSLLVHGFRLPILVPTTRLLSRKVNGGLLRTLYRSLIRDDEVNPGTVKGTSLRILEYPDPRLRAENAEVVTFDDNLHNISREMFTLMYAARGVGLAAPQVGLNMRLMVFNRAPKSPKTEQVLVNPHIVAKSDDLERDEESCLSLPGVEGSVTRPKWVLVSSQDLQGKESITKFIGYEGRIFQHEFDHLNKTLFIDHLSPKDLSANRKSLHRLQKSYSDRVAREGVITNVDAKRDQNHQNEGENTTR